MRPRLYAFISSSLLALCGSLHGQVVFTNADYTLSLHEDGRVAHIQVATPEYTNWAYGVTTHAIRTNMTRRIYDHFNDDYDILLIINDEDTLLGGAFGTHYPVQNDIQGLNKPIYDNTATYSSAGNLQSLIHLGQKSGVVGGPSLHEIAHRWANSLSTVPTEVGGHWGYAGLGGQLGGWEASTFTNLGGGNYDADGPSGSSSWGSFANGGNGIPYSELELYMMGLIPSSQVSNTVKIAQGFAWTDQGQGQFSATNILDVTIGDVISGDGVRVPAFGGAQTNFRILAVVVSDAPLSQSRWASYDSDVNSFSLPGDNASSLYNFWEATGGRAQLDMDDILSTLQPGSEYIQIVETNQLDALGYYGESFSPTSTVYTLTNTFGASITWTSQYSESWIEVSPSSGTLSAGASISVTVSLTPSAAAQPAGSYQSEVAFVNTANGVYSRRFASLTVKTVAQLPFLDDFETGSIESWWTMSGTAEYRNEVISTYAPHGGSFHLALDDLASGGAFSINEATLEIDLLGYTNVQMTFWVQDIGDEAHGPPAIPYTGSAAYDGVAISEDGVNWYHVLGLTAIPNTNYTQQVVDMDAAIALHGLSYTNRFYIRFNHYDNFSMNTDLGSSDGLTFDDIAITGSVVDSDGDGMSDNFENQYGLNPANTNDAALDTDGDGANNLAEYLADTVPTNSASVLWISSLVSSNGSDRTLFWPTSSARDYVVESATNLMSSGWVPVFSNLVGSGGVESVQDTNNTSFIYYRIRTWLP